MSFGAVVDVLGAMAAAASPAEFDIIAAGPLLAAFRGSNAAARKATLVDLMQSILAPLRTELNANGLDDGKIAKLLSDPATINWDKHPEANTFEPWSDPAPLDHGLRQYYRTRETKALFNASVAWTVFSAFLANSGGWSPAASAADASRQLVNLCALKGALSRIVISLRAAKASGTTLADAFALYRTEGNMIVPFDGQHLQKGLPPFERGFDFQYGISDVDPKVSESYRLGLKKTMQNGLWGQDKKLFIKINGEGGADFDNFMRGVAILDWHLFMVGFDYLLRRFRARRLVESGAKIYLDFLMDIRVANGLAEAERAAKRTELENEVNAIFLKLNKGEAEGRVFLTPVDSDVVLHFSAFMLTQGLLFFRASGKKEVDGPFITPNDTLRYLAYNTSHRRSIDVQANPKDLFSSVLASAAVALTKKGLNEIPDYCPNAYTILGLAGLPDELPAEGESPEHAATAVKVKAALTDPAEMEEFAQFILRANAHDWGAYRQNRGNLARYTRLLSFYKALTAGMGV